MRKLIPLLAVGFLLGALVGWLILDPSPRELLFSSGASLIEVGSGGGSAPSADTAPRVGNTAPDFELSTSENRTVRLRDLRGHPVLINFWATWCGPCRIEMPAIQSKFAEHAPDLRVLAVNLDEPVEEVRAFAREMDLGFDLLLDPGGEVSEKRYLVRAYPSSFFIDPDGVIQVIHLGLMNEGQLDDYLTRIGVE